MRISLIGLGTVGQGVVELLRRHSECFSRRAGRECTIVAALVRDPSRAREFSPDGAVITGNADRFFSVPTDLVVEVAGGVHPALEYLHRALALGRDVVTANKAVLAAHGPELFKAAEKGRRRLCFEAAVAGGVPIIRLVTDSLASVRIRWFAGILNGTCNFMLTEMARGETYDAALNQAQQLGFAEADPTLDISGEDSVQKLCILASLAFGQPIARASGKFIISTGITGLSRSQLVEAQRLGGTIKLLAFARAGIAGSIELCNGPMFVPDESPLARVHGSDMGVTLHTDSLAHMFIAGEGAGRFPTASAVVADILEVARFTDFREPPLNRYPWDQPGAAVTEAALGRIAGVPALPAE